VRVRGSGFRVQNKVSVAVCLVSGERKRLVFAKGPSCLGFPGVENNVSADDTDSLVTSCKLARTLSAAGVISQVLEVALAEPVAPNIFQWCGASAGSLSLLAPRCFSGRRYQKGNEGPSRPAGDPWRSTRPLLEPVNHRVTCPFPQDASGYNYSFRSDEASRLTHRRRSFDGARSATVHPAGERATRATPRGHFTVHQNRCTFLLQRKFLAS
jgi:hypothetical protein